MRRLPLILLLVVIAVPSLQAQTSAVAADPVLRAMQDELQRSVRELQFKDLEKPYFIQYTVLDEDEYSADATFGAITSSDRSRDRVLGVQVRVGGYDFDNSEFVAAGPFGGGAAANGVLQV